MYNIIGKRKIFLTISGVLCGISILALILWGLKPGIDFTGGTLMEITYPKAGTTISDIKNILAPLNLGEVIQPIDETSFSLRFKKVDETTHQNILKALGNIEEKRFESIGPTIGRELTQKARTAIILAILAIVIYIAWAFQKLARVLRGGESWRFSAGAILALFHDILIMLGLFAVMGHFKGTEINSTFIVAILMVLGYSVNDTIVVYDRIRENMLLYGVRNLEDVINRALNSTIVRCLNTTFTTIFAVLVIYLFGGATIRDFALAMMVGVATGAWSSISIATLFLLFRRKYKNIKS